jgi:hypothetical protein
MDKFTYAAALAGALAVASPAVATERSPVFGGANVAAMSTDAARNVTARGALANYYGYYGNQYAYNAYYYSYYARYVNPANSSAETNNYYYAYYYAYYATQNLYNAYYYSYYGQ